jgi:hypothetical protein
MMALTAADEVQKLFIKPVVAPGVGKARPLPAMSLNVGISVSLTQGIRILFPGHCGGGRVR